MTELWLTYAVPWIGQFVLLFMLSLVSVPSFLISKG